MKQTDDNSQEDNFNLPSRTGKVIQPLSKDLKSDSATDSKNDDNPAVSLIRKRINSIYGDEPDAAEELKEAKDPNVKHSKHQKYMLELSESGKSLAEIQTAWHTYYVNLPDHEKHEVWQEFYANHAKTSASPQEIKDKEKHKEDILPAEKPVTKTNHDPEHQSPDKRSVEEIKDRLLNTVSGRAKPQKSGHLKSLAFGLGMGSMVLVLLLFGFFNERVIAPFITPSRTVSSTPLVIDPSTTAVGPESKIIIPKINVEIPVIYDSPSIKEADIQKALEGGVVHYPITSKPGETGNGAIFGHSSNNILNKGKYKFAFVLLKELEQGDTFMIHKDGKRYVYKVFKKKVVPPTDLSVLEDTDKPATIALITCDPPGTSINRLVVWGEQISPEPSANVASSAQKQDKIQPASLPSDAPTLWERIRNWFIS